MFLIETDPLTEMTPASTSVPIAVKRIGNSSAGVLRGHGRKMQRRYRGIFSASMSRTKQERNWPCRLRKSPPACGRRRNPRGWQSAPARRDAQVDIPALCPHRKIPRLCRWIFISRCGLHKTAGPKRVQRRYFLIACPELSGPDAAGVAGTKQRAAPEGAQGQPVRDARKPRRGEQQKAAPVSGRA